MSPKMFKTEFFIMALAIMISAGISEAGDRVRAEADIRGCTDPNIIGTAYMKEEKTREGIKEVSVSMSVKGLERGKHAVHIHETATCEPCGAAGGHFDPGPFGMTNPDANHPFHSGDLINIKANRRGKAHLEATTTRVTLSPGPLSLFDDDGSAFIIHVNPDTYCPNGEEAGCAGGARAACGIITLSENHDDDKEDEDDD